jgi:hypothetical protein
MKYDGYDRDARTNDIEPAELTEAECLPRTFRTYRRSPTRSWSVDAQPRPPAR